MYELIQAAGNSYYLDCPAKIGLVRLSEQDVCLIDSGSDKDAGRKVRQLLDRQGWRLAAIYNTHSHADHIGGNAYLQAQTGCPIYAPGIDRCFTEYPILEPAFLYGGCPPQGLRHKFLLAKESQARPLTEADLPAAMTSVPLPGHSFDMVGFRTSDGVVYLADCLSSRETLEKYRIGFLYDVGAALDTLERVCAMEAACFIPAHAPATETIAPLARYNIDRIHAVAETILSLCREPQTFEELLRRLFLDFNLTMTIEQHALVGSTVRSYLAWLSREKRLEPVIEDARLLWHTILS